MESGKIKFFNIKKGYGFITADKGGKDVFFHFSKWEGDYDPEEKQGVNFESEKGEKGLSATSVTPV